MTQWIELTKTFQDGTPQTKAIKIPGMDEEIWFTDNAYAEVSDTVADLLASQNDFINKVSAPATPGTYYESAPQNAQVTVELPSGAFDNLSADSFDIDGGIDLVDVTGADPLSVASLESTTANSDSISSSDINNDLWASSPDDIQTQLDALPSTGGVVNLTPGSYSDSDWTQTITIPNNQPSQYSINMAGSDIDLNTFAGPYIQRNAVAGNSTQPVHIHGPDNFNVGGVTDPGDVMDLWDIGGSNIYWPSCLGSVDSIIRKNAQEGSGHMCKISVSGYGMENGIIIGDQTGGVSCDRCFWWGQLGGIKNTGVHAANGQTHHFWVQPENGETGSTGYRIDKAANYIHNNHSKCDTPLDLRADTNITAPRHQGYDESLIASRPHGFTSDRTITHLDTFYFDGTTRYDSSNVSNGTFGQINLTAGTTDGNISHLGTHNRGGGMTQLAHCSIVQKTVGSSTIRFGAYDSASDWVALEKTPSDTTWQAVAMQGGTEAFREDTGHTVTGNVKEVTVGWNMKNENYRLGVLDQDNLERSYDVSDPTVTGMPATLRPRVWLTVNGTPTSGQRIDVKQFNLGYMD